MPRRGPPSSRGHGCGTKPAEARARVWIFWSLAWVLENREHFDDPYTVIEDLYTEFGYPEEMSGVVRFMPVPEGGEPGLEGVSSRWSEYVATMKSFYAGLDSCCS
ncbi:MAG: DUF2247 family protein [Actinomycetota bacterium]